MREMEKFEALQRGYVTGRERWKGFIGIVGSASWGYRRTVAPRTVYFDKRGA